ncbi:MAG TPA: hypothetical protein VMU29_00705 [Smithella sp.]|nr:hypothetical protein [Smithella sp.]
MELLFVRRSFLRIIKNPSFIAVKLLWLTIFVYGCAGQAIVYPDSLSEKTSAAISGPVAEDDVLSAVVHINLTTPDGYYPTKAALILKKPSYLRLEILPVIGTPDFFLAASPEKMSIFIPSKGKFYYGQPTGANLRKFIPWPLNIEDIVMIFSGTYPSLKEDDITYQNYREKNLLRIEMKAPSGCSQIIRVGEQDRLLKLIRNDKTGKEVYTVTYLYDEVQGSLPKKITVSMADGVTSLSVKFLDVKIEKATDLSMFDLPMPADVNAILLN